MNDCSVAEKTVKILSDNDLKIAVAESLTGGMVAAEFVDVPGVSKVFIEGIVAYANEAKISRLGVKKETLEKFGAVSEETAREMAEGLIKNDVNVSLSTTGIAGPSGGSAAKPVGTVCFGFRVNGITYTKKQFFNGNRQEIRKKSTDFALNALYLLLSDDIDAFNAL
ncbi:MAG: CinA family protein [Eubacteriales bacterium]|nr:CinA family protein [Christensenellaceae bacterium]MDD7092325.1 CinA family protein [Christensenellaceae bacterium]MDY3240924.1 CinA family protein [Eubacteriales bacterium]